MARRPDRGPSAASWGRAAEAGWEAVLSMGVGMLIGYYADRWLGTDPWLFILFLFFGLAAAIRRLVRLSKQTPGGDPPGDPPDAPGP